MKLILISVKRWQEVVGEKAYHCGLNPQTTPLIKQAMHQLEIPHNHRQINSLSVVCMVKCVSVCVRAQACIPASVCS